MPPLPEYKIDAFVQRKVAPGSEARQLVSAAKIRAGSASEKSSAAGDAAAVRRLEAFLDAFTALKPGDIASPQQWHAFVSGHAACGDAWEKSLHFDALLSDIFGFSDATAAALRASEVAKRDKASGEVTTVSLEHAALRWVSKALGGFGPAGCFTDLVNLVFAMMNRPPCGDLVSMPSRIASATAAPLIPSETEILLVPAAFQQRLAAGRSDWLHGSGGALRVKSQPLWVPTHLVMDCESDDTLCWALLTHMHACLKESNDDSDGGVRDGLQVIAQLPSSEPALDGLAEKLSALPATTVFRDPDASNAAAIMANFRITSPPPSAPRSTRRRGKSGGARPGSSPR